MRTKILMTLLVMLASPAVAEQLSCSGDNPHWSLTVSGESGVFELTQPVTMDIPLVTKAERRDWPRAYSLIGDRDTVIAVVDRDACVLRGQDFDLSADILTQRGSTAIVLTGCCAVAASR